MTFKLFEKPFGNTFVSVKVFFLIYLIFSSCLVSESLNADDSGKTSVLKKIRILMLGDSLTEGYGVAKVDAFPALIEKKLKAKGFNVEVINSGMSGSTSASAAKRLKWHLRKKPDILFLALGANDGLRGNKIETLEQNLNKTIELAKKSGVYVILAGMKVPMNYGSKYRDNFEKVYMNLEKIHAIPRIPFLLEGVAGEKSLNITDGIHPNENGHKIMADTVMPFFERALKSLQE